MNILPLCVCVEVCKRYCFYGDDLLDGHKFGMIHEKRSNVSDRTKRKYRCIEVDSSKFTGEKKSLVIKLKITICTYTKSEIDNTLAQQTFQRNANKKLYCFFKIYL